MPQADSRDTSEEERALIERVECGEIRREALEILSLLGDPSSRHALGQLPLVLSGSTAAGWPEGEPELPHAQSWRAFALWLEPFGRSLAVESALVTARALLETLTDHKEPPARSHVGFHTGPAGVIDVSPEFAAELFPLMGLLERTVEKAEAWLEEPSSAHAAELESAWPRLLLRRKKAVFCAELIGVDWRVVWACRWLVASVGDEAGAAAACAAAYAEEPLGGRFVVNARLREALRPRLLGG